MFATDKAHGKTDRRDRRHRQKDLVQEVDWRQVHFLRRKSVRGQFVLAVTVKNGSNLTVFRSPVKAEMTAGHKYFFMATRNFNSN